MADKTVTDSTGRTLLLREIEADEMLDLMEAAGVSAGNSAYMQFALIVASVSSVDGVPMPRITSKAMLRSNAAAIKNAGIVAASREMMGGDTAAADADEQIATAKN